MFSPRSKRTFAIRAYNFERERSGARQPFTAESGALGVRRRAHQRITVFFRNRAPKDADKGVRLHIRAVPKTRLGVQIRPVSEAVRGVSFFLSAAFILFAPAYRVFSDDAPSYAIRWEMFSGIARDLYEVTFETTDASGARVPVDRFELLGYPDAWSAPRSVRTVKQESEAWALARVMCRALGERRPLFMKLRDATRRGWSVVEDGQHDVCDRARSAPASTKRPGPPAANMGSEESP